METFMTKNRMGMEPFFDQEHQEVNGTEQEWNDWEKRNENNPSS